MKGFVTTSPLIRELQPWLRQPQPPNEEPLWRPDELPTGQHTLVSWRPMACALWRVLHPTGWREPPLGPGDTPRQGRDAPRGAGSKHKQLWGWLKSLQCSATLQFINPGKQVAKIEDLYHKIVTCKFCLTAWYVFVKQPVFSQWLVVRAKRKIVHSVKKKGLGQILSCCKCL